MLPDPALRPTAQEALAQLELMLFCPFHLTAHASEATRAARRAAQDAVARKKRSATSRARRGTLAALGRDLELRERHFPLDRLTDFESVSAWVLKQELSVALGLTAVPPFDHALAFDCHVHTGYEGVHLRVQREDGSVGWFYGSNEGAGIAVADAAPGAVRAADAEDDSEQKSPAGGSRKGGKASAKKKKEDAAAEEAAKHKPGALAHAIVLRRQKEKAAAEKGQKEKAELKKGPASPNEAEDDVAGGGAAGGGGEPVAEKVIITDGMEMFKQWIVHVTPGYVYRANLQRLRRLRPFIEVASAAEGGAAGGPGARSPGSGRSPGTGRSPRRRKKKKAKTPTTPLSTDKNVHELSSITRQNLDTGRAMHF